VDVSASLAKFVPFAVRTRGTDLFRSGCVKVRKGDASRVEAVVRGSREYTVMLSREYDDVLVSCDCPYFDSDGPCKHIWATLLAAGNAGHLRGDLNLPPTDLIDVHDVDNDDEVDDYFDSLQFGAGNRPVLSMPTPWSSKPTWRDTIRTIGSAAARPAEKWPEDRELYYSIDVTNTRLSG
jgi:hypothetical protein